MIHIAEPTFDGNEIQYVNEALTARRLSMGLWVERFEKSIAQATEAAEVVAVSSGTAALHVAMLALGIKDGDNVIVPSCSYIATANAVRYCGANPILLDVDPDTWVLDPDNAAAAALATGARGIITVHLYGNPCPVPQVPGVWVLEDACEAHGLPLRGDASVLSFFGNKIVTTGEGGAICFPDVRRAREARLYRGQGTTGRKRYIHEVVGFNYRLTDIQAALGVGQMETLHESLARRRLLYNVYREELKNKDVKLQLRDANAPDWVMPILVENRDEVAQRLENEGVETRPVFPPIHRQPCYSSTTGPRLPVSDELAEKGLLLPLHLGMTPDDVNYICGLL